MIHQCAKRFGAATALAISILAGTSATEYSLDSYLEKVERDNPDMALARQNAAAAIEGMKQARSALLPSVGVSAGYARNFIDIEKSYPVASTGPGPLVWDDIDSNLDNELTMAAGLNFNLFNPEAIARYEQAKRNQRIQGLVGEMTGDSIMVAAKKLYARTQLALAVLDVRRETEETSREVFEDARRRYQAGVAIELDMRMAEVDWKTNASSTAEARKDAELALMAFRSLAGIPQSEEIELTESFDRLPDFPAAIPDLEDILPNRSEYQIQILMKEIAEISRKNAKGSFLPTIGGTFSYASGFMGNGASFSDYDYNSLQLGLSVSVPVYTGGYRRSLMESARIEMESSSLRVMKAQDEIEQELLSLYYRMQEAGKRLESARTLEEAAARAYDLARASLENGFGTQLAVSQASARYSQASVNLRFAVYNYRSVYYDWELAVGE